MDILKELLDIGFSEYEAKVYSALVSGSKMSASEVSRVADVPKGRVYGILGELMDMGMCIMVPGTVKRYQALPPQKTFSILFDKQRKEYEAKEAKGLKLSEHLSSIFEEEGHSENDFDSVSIYTSVPNIAKKSEYMIDNAEKVHRSLCKPPYSVIQSIDDVEKKSGPFLEAIKRGTDFRTIYELEEDDMENFIYICKYFHEKGEQVKIMDKLPIKLIIMDSKAVMFTMYHKSVKRNKFTSMFVENSDIVFALTDLFDHYWSIATDYTDFVKNGYKLN